MTARRYSVERWDKDVLLAASISIVSCKPAAAIGINFHAQDGSPFAHGPCGIHDAKTLRDALNVAISEIGGPDS